MSGKMMLWHCGWLSVCLVGVWGTEYPAPQIIATIFAATILLSYLVLWVGER